MPSAILLFGVSAIFGESMAADEGHELDRSQILGLKAGAAAGYPDERL